MDYEDSESDEDDYSKSNSLGVFVQNENMCAGRESESLNFCQGNTSLVSTDDNRSVCVSEVPDIESQIMCTSIEKNNDSDMAISDGDDDDDLEGEGDDNSFKKYSINEYISVSCANETGSERKVLLPQETIVISEKPVEVTQVIKKINENDKNIGMSQNDNNMINLNVYKNHNMDFIKLKTKDCDSGIEEGIKMKTPCCLTQQKNVVNSSKRTYQSLKSVRIPKKGNRKCEFSGKRQKVDET